MYNFRGKLDEKNRLTIPAEIRTEFAGNLYITPGFGDTLHLYTDKTWKELERGLTVNPAGDATPTILNQDLAERADHFYGSLQVTRLDAARGRLTIEPELIAHAGLGNVREWKAIRVPTDTGYYWRIRRADRKTKL